MDETTKAKQYWGHVEKKAICGSGIDIGCGPDPVTPDARRFDIEDGDANRISEFVGEQFDFVYSSHCLEHMYDPYLTIIDWWKLVKPGGYLFIFVPDEDLYEQGVFPSRFNADHKMTFTISKSKSWSPNSVNVLALAAALPEGRIISLELQDRGYDRSLMSFGNPKKKIWIKLVSKMARALGVHERTDVQRLLSTYYPIDQTVKGRDAQAQIQLIVQKADLPGGRG
jgi:SAM-dependent methyltransferase